MVSSRTASAPPQKKCKKKGLPHYFNATAPFFMECGVRRRAPGLRIKTENKGIAGSRAQTAPALQRGKTENPGTGFAHQNGE